MRLLFESDEDLRRYIADQVLTSTEVIDYMGISRQRVNQLIADGRIVPFKEMKSTRLFFKEDIPDRGMR